MTGHHNRIDVCFPKLIGRGCCCVLLAGWMAVSVAAEDARPAAADAIPEPPQSHPLEMWDAVYLKDAKIGFVKTVSDRMEIGGQQVVVVDQTSDVTVPRFKDSMRMIVRTKSFERLSGQLYAVDTLMTMANEQQRMTGLLKDDGLFHLTTRTPGKTETDTLKWSADVLGPDAARRLLHEKPLAPGTQHVYQSFLPELNKIATTTVTAVGREKVALLDGSTPSLLKLESSTDVLPVTVTMWVDDKGTVLKSVLPLNALSMTSYRVSQEEALREGTARPVDLGYQTLVPIDRAIPNAHQTRAVNYRLTFTDPMATSTIPEAAYQKVIHREDAQHIVVRVTRTTPAIPPAPGDQEAGEEYRESNAFIQSDAPLVKATAERVTAGETDPWKKAVLLERWVHENMVNRDFTIGFATAAEVMTTKQGDCTEHAVLLAALCRAVGVPSRVAMGLVYLSGSKSFGYHMWTEVNIAGTWYGLDGTLGAGYIAGGHLKLGEGSLKGASPLNTLLPIIRIIGKLQITVQRVEES